MREQLQRRKWDRVRHKRALAPADRIFATFPHPPASG